MFSQCEQGRSHRAGRMNDGLQMRVVEVEGVRGDAVDQRSAGHVDFFAATGQGGLFGRLQHRDRSQRGVGSFMMGGADGAAKPVHEGAVRFMVDFGAPAAIGKAGVGGDEFGQDLGDRWCIVVGDDLGIASHGIFP